MNAELHKIEQDLRDMAPPPAGAGLSVLGARLCEQLEQWLARHVAFESWCATHGH